MVSIHKVPVGIQLIISLICFIFRFKRGTLFLPLHEVFDYLTNQIRKAHDVTRERFLLIFWSVLMKVSKFHVTNNKQKRFFMS